MKYEMRGLKTQDIFKMSKILKKMDLKNDVKSLIARNTAPKASEEKESLTMALGIEVVMLAIENMHMAEAEWCDLLGGLIGITPNEFADLELEQTAEVLDLFTKNPSLPAFISAVGRLMK